MTWWDLLALLPLAAVAVAAVGLIRDWRSDHDNQGFW